MVLVVVLVTKNLLSSPFDITIKLSAFVPTPLNRTLFANSTIEHKNTTALSAAIVLITSGFSTVVPVGLTILTVFNLVMLIVAGMYNKVDTILIETAVGNILNNEFTIRFVFACFSISVPNFGLNFATFAGVEIVAGRTVFN